MNTYLVFPCAVAGDAQAQGPAMALAEPTAIEEPNPTEQEGAAEALAAMKLCGIAASTKAGSGKAGAAAEDLD